MHYSIQAHFQFNFGSTKRLNLFEVDEACLRLIIKNFNVNKVHVWNNLFTIVLPMKLLLKLILGKEKVYFQKNGIFINPQKRVQESSENLWTY